MDVILCFVNLVFVPQCKKCSNQFPNRIKVDGIERTLNSRRYCLDCSPFGQHNTRQLHSPNGIDKDPIRVCSRCNKIYDYAPQTGKSKFTCQACAVSKARRKRKLQSIEYMGGKCTLCGYARTPYSMHFHHVDRTQKTFSISSKTWAWDKVQKELDKCILVCANCHGEIETGLISVAQ